MSTSIFLIHRVAPRLNDRWGLTIDPDEFERFVTALAASGTLVTLAEALTPAPADHREVRCAITFDDAYDDLRRHAFPLLERLGAPATLFPPTAHVADGTPFWWEALRWLEQHPAELAAAARRWGWRMEGCPEATVDRWCPRFKRMSPGERDERIAEIGLPPGLPGAMDIAGLKGLPETVRVECHGHSHTVLSALTAGQLRDELERSRTLLESWTGHRPTIFAYPNGQPEDFSAEHFATLRDHGLNRAVTTVPGTVGAGHGPYEVPRIGLIPGRAEHQLMKALGA